MELHVLQIVHPYPGPLGHGDACAVGFGTVGGMQVHLPHAAGGQHGPVRQHGVHHSRGLVENISAKTLIFKLITKLHPRGMVMGRDKIHGGTPGQHADQRGGLDFPTQPLHDRAPGMIRAMENP